MWIQNINPFNNITISALVALIPILFLLISLITRKISGYIATILTLIIAFFTATLAFHMPSNLAFSSALYGAINGLFPIGWIVLSAVFLYNLSVKSGGFAIVRDYIESITADRRLQALLIAFCFGAFLEGSAGFGAPVAITAGMLVGLGFQPLYAAGICLVANTAPVAFGGIGIAVVTAGQLTNIDPNVLSRMIAHQLPLLALLLPFWLICIISGWRGAKQVWPAILVTGGSYAITMFLTATYLGPSLPDILSSLVSIVCLILFLKVWQPKKLWRFPHEKEFIHAEIKKHSLMDNLRAWTPFLLLIIFVGSWGSIGLKPILDKTSILLPVNGLNHAILVADKLITVNYNFVWLSSAGTAILLAALVSALILRFKISMVWKTYIETLHELSRPLLTISSIVGFAYLANYSGMSATLGQALTATGRYFPLVSPLLGWLGVFITGSDTSSNALFSTTQKITATHLGINPVLTVTANSTGGVTAKMISPQSIAVAAAATKLEHQEGNLFRFTILHSIGLVIIICIMTYLQAYYLTDMVPKVEPLVRNTVTQIMALK